MVRQVRQKPGGDNNPYGALGERARYRAPAIYWADEARARLETVYDNDPVLILQTARQLMLGGFEALNEEARLAALAEDYAAYWLLQKMDGNPPPEPDRQLDYWKETLSIPNCRHFDLIQAGLGWDLLTPRLAEHKSTVLMLFASDASPEEVGELLRSVPATYRTDYVNQRNRLGLTVLHGLAYGGQTGVATVLVEHGAQLDAVTSFDMGKGLKVEGTVAHLATVNAEPYLLTELMTLDRNLFTSATSSRMLDYTPYDLGVIRAEDMMEACGRQQFRDLAVSAFTAIASKGNMVAVPAQPPKNQALQYAYACNLQKAVNIAAYAIDKPLPFGEYADIVNRLPLTRPLVDRNALH